MGAKDSYASMKYYCIDNGDILGIELNLEENVSTAIEMKKR
jgi:hypothetical protein